MNYNYQEKHNFTLTSSQLKEREFISHYVTESIPLIIKNETINWNAYKNWSNKDYMINKLANKNITVHMRIDPVIAYFLDGFKSQYMEYKEFVKLSTMHNRISNYFYHEQNLHDNLSNDIIKPSFTDLLRLQTTLISQVK